MRRTTGRIVAAVAAVGMAVPAGASAAGLSQERYDALDAVYTAAARLPDDADLSALRAVCSKLDASDAVLGTQRRQCESLTRFLEAGQLEGCDDDAPGDRATARAAQSRTTCLRSIGEARRKAATLARDSQAAQRALARNVSPARCRDEIGPTAKDVRGIRGLASAYGALERAVRARDEKAADRAAKRIASSPVLETDEDESPFAARKRFRKACKPSG